jgi:hypothetical protein
MIRQSPPRTPRSSRCCFSSQSRTHARPPSAVHHHNDAHRTECELTLLLLLLSFLLFLSSIARSLARCVWRTNHRPTSIRSDRHACMHACSRGPQSSSVEASSLSLSSSFVRSSSLARLHSHMLLVHTHACTPAHLHACHPFSCSLADTQARAAASTTTTTTNSPSIDLSTRHVNRVCLSHHCRRRAASTHHALAPKHTEAIAACCDHRVVICPLLLLLFSFSRWPDHAATRAIVFLVAVNTRTLQQHVCLFCTERERRRSKTTSACRVNVLVHSMQHAARTSLFPPPHHYRCSILMHNKDDVKRR